MRCCNIIAFPETESFQIFQVRVAFLSTVYQQKRDCWRSVYLFCSLLNCEHLFSHKCCACFCYLNVASIGKLQPLECSDRNVLWGYLLSVNIIITDRKYIMNRKSKLNVNKFWKKRFLNAWLLKDKGTSCFRVSQSVEWNDMSSRKLAASFVPVLLRPTHQYIM